MGNDSLGSNDLPSKGAQLFDCYEYALGEQGIEVDPWPALEQRERDAWELFAEKAEEMMSA